jgi:uncharacterized protein (DUF362 family)
VGVNVQYVARTEHREKFVQELLIHLDIAKMAQKVQRILIKPNIVSHELYPTTTHPDVLSSCLKFLSPGTRRLL